MIEEGSESTMDENTFVIDEDAYLAHYGVLRKSGRYPWGSGENPNQRASSFLDNVQKLRKEGLSDTEIARGFGMTTTELRATTTIARNAKKQHDIGYAERLKAKGMSNIAIGQQMGLNESSVRALLADGVKDRADILNATSDMLKRQVEEKGYIDVGSGVENHLGLARTKLDTSLAMLKAEGYEVINVQVDQLGTASGQKTIIKVLAPPGTTYKDVVTTPDSIRQIQERSDDGGRSFLGIQPPVKIDPDRVGINYAEDGGSNADGVIYVRRGVDDVSLGPSNYAQVRIAVGDGHYLKGMAIYKDDMPDGVDLVFNTNKKNTGNKLDAMKETKADPDNPFGAAVDQLKRPGKNGEMKVYSAMNTVYEEGDWGSWSKNMASQMLSKQNHILAKTQLGLKYDDKKTELDEILALTNPTVKKKLLESFSDDVDAQAVHLQAKAMPRQATHVILPVDKLKDTEIYAPNYRDGERVVLIRYPHGGTFEIPELKVNNKHPEAKALLGDARDAVGINARVAQKLSGADFDGDTVLVIPNNAGRIKTKASLDGLKDFDPQAAYKPYDGMPTIDGGRYNAKTKKVDYPPGKQSSPRGKGMQMGLVSNLITDMTIKGATDGELARAVRHSMVVIDAEKHKLDYKQSAIDNGIPDLMKKYQGRSQGGASTLISRATSPEQVEARKNRVIIDPETGKRSYIKTGESYTNAQGKVIVRTQRSTKLAEADDAHTLSSGTPIEKVYADHSNRLKSMANEARRVMVNTKSIPYSPSAKKVYDKEVKELNSALNLALQNRPKERAAQLLANSVVAEKTRANPGMDAAELKKLKGQALTEARNRVGASKQQIEITDRQWEAIQAGAVSNSKLQTILNNANIDRIKELATPRTTLVMSAQKQQRAKQMLNAGATRAEVAQALGVPVSTLTSSLES